jgi:tetratricopeptide (TPR) repeat protein
MFLSSSIYGWLSAFLLKRKYRLLPALVSNKTSALFALVMVTAIGLTGCSDAKIVNEKEIAVYLTNSTNEKLKAIETEITFWSKRLEEMKEDAASRIKLGSLYNRRFQYTGSIADVHKSDSFYLAAHELQKLFGSGTYRSLAVNCVTKHEFKEANAYLDSAFAKGDDQYITLLQQFDVAVELGDYLRAQTILHQFKYKNTFEYYIREAKLMDHKGEAEASLSAMEKAMSKALELKNDELIRWAKSNLADMYGHQNKIKESYTLYKEVLKEDPHYYHALKGIAWIAYSNDRNTKLAKQILQHLQILHPVPDYDLLLGEIATYENNNTEKEFYTNRFLKAVENPAYGAMYNKYVFGIMSDELSNYSDALRIANAEVNNRPTPQSYDLLAWAYYKNKQLPQAELVANNYIAKRNYEPDALFHLGVIYFSSGNKELAKQYLNEALESSYELGPLVTNEINEYLKQL